VSTFRDLDSAFPVRGRAAGKAVRQERNRPLPWMRDEEWSQVPVQRHACVETFDMNVSKDREDYQSLLQRSLDGHIRFIDHMKIMPNGGRRNIWPRIFVSYYAVYRKPPNRPIL